MKLDDLKKDWRNKVEAHPKKDLSPALAIIKEETGKLDNAVKRRNIAETVAAFFIFVISVILLFRSDSLMQSIGLCIWIVACVLVPFKLFKASHRKVPLEGMKPYLLEEKRKISNQVNLMSSVLWWYILPLYTGIVLVYIGAQLDVNGDISLSAENIVYLMICSFLAIAIYAYNSYAVRKKLQPLIYKIDQRLAALDE